MLRKFSLAMLFMMMMNCILAQMAIKLETNQTAYIKYEPIYVHVGIRNDSGRPLVFGQNEKLLANLYFEITDINNKPVFKQPPQPIALTTGKVINPGQVGNIVLKLSHYIQLHDEGTYRIHAYIRHPMFKETFKSNNVRIDIVPGVTVWTRTVGVPDGKFSDGKVISHDSSRTYSIRKLNTATGQYYYCTLENKSKFFQVFRIGPVIGGTLPSCLVDMTGTLHILAKVNPKIYKYYKVDISGALLDDNKYYKITRTAPSLAKGDDGKVFVTGGTEAVKDVDFIIDAPSYKIMGEE